MAERPGSPNGSAAHVPFEQAAAQVLGNLQNALAELFKGGPVQVRKAGDLERGFGLDRKLSWQVHRIATAENPLAAGTSVPPRAATQRFLKAAARRRIPAVLIGRVSEAFDQFERLVEVEAGDRTELEAMLSAFLPESRAKQELAARQAAFKGMSQIKGVAMEADVGAMFLHPGADEGSLDRVTLSVNLGVRRVRPDARIVLGTGDMLRPDTSILTLDNRPSADPTASLLREFCTSPLPRFVTHESEGMLYYRVAGEDVGMRSAVDLVMADQRAAALPRFCAPGARRVRGTLHIVDTPAKRLTFDVFLHRDAYPGVAPLVHIYDTAGRGPVTAFDDPARENDRLHVQDSIRPLPPGTAGARLPHVPRYVEMLEHVHRCKGWDSSEFRGFRLDALYPVYGAQYMIGFTLPDAPV